MSRNPITGKEELAQVVPDSIAGKEPLDLSNVASGAGLTTLALASDGGVSDAMLTGQTPSAAVSGTVNALRCAVVTYDFATDGGGAPGVITPAKTVTLPSGAVIIGAGVRVITKPDSAGSTATIAIGTSAGSSATSIKAALVVSDATWNANSVSAAVAPIFTVATFVRMTAAGQVILTTATQALTVGKFDIFIVYFVGSAA